MCHVCAMKEMEEHKHQVHFNSCTICERVLLRSLEKIDHIQQDHKENLSSGEEVEFQSNIQRQSIIVPSKSYSKIIIEFVADAEPIKDLKRKRTKGT